MAHEPDAQLTTLFPELRTWNGGDGVSVSTWLSTFGSIPQAIAYSTLFCPEFVEHEGCILSFGFEPQTSDDWIRSLGGDRTRAEMVINHVHISSLFFPGEVYTSEQMDYLGRVLKKMWTLKLQHDFPLSGVQVEFLWNDRDDYDDAQLTVYCQRP